MADSTRDALVDLSATLESAPVGFRHTEELTVDRLEAGRPWLDEMLGSAGRAVALLSDPRWIGTYVFAMADRLRSRLEDVAREVSRTGPKPSTGERDGLPYGAENRIDRALTALPFSLGVLGEVVREAIAAVDREAAKIEAAKFAAAKVETAKVDAAAKKRRKADRPEDMPVIRLVAYLGNHPEATPMDAAEYARMSKSWVLGQPEWKAHAARRRAAWAEHRGADVDGG